MSEDFDAIARYVMPVTPLEPADVALLFGTRHGVEEFCDETMRLWREGYFKKLIISGGCTAGQDVAEAKLIAEALLKRGMPANAMILECEALNTGDNVIFSKRLIGEEVINSIIAIGKISSARRYLMTLARHWPGPRVMMASVNYFGVPYDAWHTH